MADYEVEVLVRGRPVKVFKHKGDHFIEGRSGSSFELKITNNTWDRIEVVGSVDGLSVTDGEECGPESDGYIVPPKESIVIPGWKLPNDKAAEFVFEDKRKSYSNQVGKGTQNVGVIGFMVFTEKVIEKPDSIVIPQPNPQPYPVPTPLPNPHPWDKPWDRTLPWNPTIPYWTSNSGGQINDAASDGTRGITSQIYSSNTDISQELGVKGSGMVNMSDSFEDSSMYGALIGASANVVTESLAVNVEEELDSAVAENLFVIGTGWGDEVDHKVSQVEFERTDKFNPDKILSIFYDGRKGLEARGIQVIRTKKKKVSDLPNAFPTYKSSGCKAPPDWKGMK